MNWTAILAANNIPEPPGYQQLVAQLKEQQPEQEQPKPKRKRK